MTDVLTSIDDRVQEQSVKRPANNSADNPADNLSERSPEILDLLVPWDIPLECQLELPVKQQIEESLRSLLQALNNPNFFEAQHQIHKILNTFSTPETQPAQVKITKTALSTADVEDYDTYFHINHVQTSSDEATALLITRGLLTNCNKFITLCCTTPNLSPQHITQQKQGFISYIYLLTRVFNIQDFPHSSSPSS